MPENTNTNQITWEQPINNEQQTLTYQESINSLLENLNQNTADMPNVVTQTPIDILNTIKKKHQQKNIDNDSKTPNYVFGFTPLDLQTAKHKKIIRDYYYNSGNVLNIFEFKIHFQLLELKLKQKIYYMNIL